MHVKDIKKVIQDDDHWKAEAQRYANDAAGLAFALRRELGGEEDVDWQAIAMEFIANINEPQITEPEEEPEIWLLSPSESKD